MAVFIDGVEVVDLTDTDEEGCTENDDGWSGPDGKGERC